MSIAPDSRTISAGVKTFPLAMWGVCCSAAVCSSSCSFLSSTSRFVCWSRALDRVFRDVVWLSGAPIVLGTFLILADFVLFYRARRHGHELSQVDVDRTSVTVVLTAYNDELSIADAVRDFASNPVTKRVIVVDNNSADGTAAAAREAGAIVVTELKPGYGYCVHRALTEGAKYDDTALVALCEGDMTFRAADLEKLLAYIPHGDVVNGTRIVEQLREKLTQLTTFMFWGNFVGGKLLEFKHLGQRYGDRPRNHVQAVQVVISSRAPRGLRPPSVNLEFNAHFLDITLKNGFKLVEAARTFHARESASPRVGMCQMPARPRSA